MKNQLIENMPREEYDKIPGAVNHSFFRGRTPADWRWNKDNPRLPTEAMFLGLAFDCYVLQREKFERWYYVAPKTRRGTKAWDELEKEAKGRTIILEDQFADISRWADALHSCSEAWWYLEGGRKQDVAVWTDTETNVLCKGMIDCWRPKILVDLKTTNDITQASFEKCIYELNYYRQLAVYADALRTLGKDVEHCAIIAVQTKDYPHVCVYRIRDRHIELGLRIWRKLLNTYRQCMARDEWPGHPSEPVEVGIPLWAEKQLEQDYSDIHEFR